MNTFQSPRSLRVLVAVLALPWALAACDDPSPPHAMTLVQAADSADGDAQQARAALAGTSLHEYLQVYFGEQLSAPDAAPAQTTAALVPTD